MNVPGAIITSAYVRNALNGSVYRAFVWQPEEMFEWLTHCAAEAVMSLMRVAK